MREYLSEDREANAIRLQRSTFSGTFLLVEGSSDRVFYERFVEQLVCRVVPISGKPSSKLRVIAVLRILEEDSNFQGILAIVDADFDRLATPLYRSSNILYTDTHDLESMLIASPALDKILAEFGSEKKICEFNRDVRLAILESGIPIGYLLWLSQCDALNLTFHSIKFSKFINETNLQIDESKLLCEVRNKSQAFSLTEEDLKQRMSLKKNDKHNHWQVCSGHHLVKILSLALQKTIGSMSAADVEPDRLERSLRLAYEESYFRNTELYLEILKWEDNNQPFKVLRSQLQKDK